MQTGFFRQLPDAIDKHLLSFCDGQSLIAASQVCKGGRRLTRDPELQASRGSAVRARFIQFANVAPVANVPVDWRGIYLREATKVGLTLLDRLSCVPVTPPKVLLSQASPRWIVAHIPDASSPNGTSAYMCVDRRDPNAMPTRVENQPLEKPCKIVDDSLISSEGNEIVVRNLAQGADIERTFNPGLFTEMRVSRDRWVGTRDNQLAVWNWRTGVLERTKPCPAGFRDPDGLKVKNNRAVTIGHRDDSIAIWNLDSDDAPPQKIGTHPDVRSTRFLAGDRLLSLSSRAIRIWDLQQGLLLKSHDSGEKIAGLRKWGSKVILATGEERLRLSIWDLYGQAPAPTPITTFPAGNQAAKWAVMQAIVGDHIILSTGDLRTYAVSLHTGHRRLLAPQFWKQLENVTEVRGPTGPSLLSNKNMQGLELQFVDNGRLRPSKASESTALLKLALLVVVVAACIYRF